MAGLEEAIDVVTARSGTHFDPAIVAAIRVDPAGLFEGLDEAPSTSSWNWLRWSGRG